MSSPIEHPQYGSVIMRPDFDKIQALRSVGVLMSSKTGEKKSEFIYLKGFCSLFGPDPGYYCFFFATRLDLR